MARAGDPMIIRDDLGMDVALGRMGGSTTVLVHTGMSAGLDHLDRVPEQRRPDGVIEAVADLLPRL
jgi:ribonucleotide monophosphatase NagD (HAD superfamily)